MTGRTIAVDEEVYAELARRAVAFIDREPNDALRRVLGLDEASARVVSRVARPRVRQRKVQLSGLVARGLLARGETLVCVDYGGNAIPGGEAQVGTGNKLVRQGRHYSMSALACELLRSVGHQADVARGPVHWRRSSDGRSLLDIWRTPG